MDDVLHEFNFLVIELTPEQGFKLAESIVRRCRCNWGGGIKVTCFELEFASENCIFVSMRT